MQFIHCLACRVCESREPREGKAIPVETWTGPEGSRG
jgi:hypothetical protein